MNQIILRYHDGNTSQYQLRLEDESLAYNHIISILRSKVGDILKFSLVDLKCMNGIIEEITQDLIKIRFVEVFPSTCYAIKDIHFIIGICRPASMKKILEWGTSLGVTKFSFFKGELSDLSYLNSTLFSQQYFEPFLYAGMAQTRGLYRKPSVYFYENLNNIKVDVESFKLTCSLESTHKLIDLFSRQNKENIVIVLGPERGLTQRELSILDKNGFDGIYLSSKVLRVELAMVSILAQLEMLIK